MFAFSSRLTRKFFFLSMTNVKMSLTPPPPPLFFTLFSVHYYKVQPDDNTVSGRNGFHSLLYLIPFINVAGGWISCRDTLDVPAIRRRNVGKPRFSCYMIMQYFKNNEEQIRR